MSSAGTHLQASGKAGISQLVRATLFADKHLTSEIRGRRLTEGSTLMAPTKARTASSKISATVLSCAFGPDDRRPFDIEPDSAAC
jgi:hypothetical protein